MTQQSGGRCLQLLILSLPKPLCSLGQSSQLSCTSAASDVLNDGAKRLPFFPRFFALSPCLDWDLISSA